MTIVSKSVKIYSYRADGLHIITPRTRFDVRPVEVVVTYEKLTEKEKKRQKQIDAIKRKNNAQALKKVVR
ncbi:TPA: hypothetical protein JG872_000342 [Enterobacter hormaechei subsp. xiangfangensis]|nr:hypothetical protein [Enterobacter hormaechei subsp. xiangfangensis]HAV1860648.1 hypothetical protein [Enterobacter hormaechei subsp. xiangfangensis]